MDTPARCGKDQATRKSRSRPTGRGSSAKWCGKIGIIPPSCFGAAGNETITDVVSHYAAEIRQEDSPHLRLVTYAANGKEAANCDFVAQNTYAGWYVGQHIHSRPDTRLRHPFAERQQLTGCVFSTRVLVIAEPSPQAIPTAARWQTNWPCRTWRRAKSTGPRGQASRNCRRRWERSLPVPLHRG